MAYRRLRPSARRLPIRLDPCALLLPSAAWATDSDGDDLPDEWEAPGFPLLDPLRSPARPEACDGLDGDCSGAPDPSELDLDQDGYAPCMGDCDDADGSTWPGAPEDPEGDVHANSDGYLGDADVDGDGHTVGGGDCDDGDPTVHPGAEEVCDGADTDCDGETLPEERTDLDGDGAPACADCAPLDPARDPGAVEQCNGIDDDCDGEVDEGWDADGDGARVWAFDCDDTDASVRWGCRKSATTAWTRTVTWRSMKAARRGPVRPPSPLRLAVSARVRPAAGHRAGRPWGSWWLCSEPGGAEVDRQAP